ncbi:MAG TPA: hypothetical protein VNV85_10120 [Puia sp.]|nr:hypothetical protein [Puia sp.]
MRCTLTIIFLVASSQIFAQQTSHKPNWTDTTFILVKLVDTSADKKIVLVDIGQKAIIYLKEKLIKQSVIETSNDLNKDELSNLIHLLVSNALRSDTIIIDQYLIDFDHMISKQLQKGNAKVFYKKAKSFVPTISHRLEKYGMYAHRFFYLPDRRPFFSTLEYSGIIQNNKYHSDPNELVKLGEKLASIREE